MSAPAFETAEQMVDAHWSEGRPREMVAMVRADREAIAAKCEQMAAETDREAEAQGVSENGFWVVTATHRERALYCEGQASAFRALASMLRGAK